MTFGVSKERIIFATSRGVYDVVAWHPPQPGDSQEDEVVKPRNKTYSGVPYFTSAPAVRLLHDQCIVRLEILRTPGTYYNSIIGVAKDAKVTSTKTCFSHSHTCTHNYAHTRTHPHTRTHTHVRARACKVNFLFQCLGFYKHHAEYFTVVHGVRYHVTRATHDSPSRAPPMWWSLGSRIFRVNMIVFLISRL